MLSEPWQKKLLSPEDFFLSEALYGVSEADTDRPKLAENA